MVRRILLSSLAVLGLALPTHFARADKPAEPVPAPAAPAPPSPEPEATVQDVEMLVDAHVNGKDVWSPGGRELDWVAAKCPYKVSFKAQVQVDAPTKVTFRWDRSDGTQSDVETVDVKKAGTLVDLAPLDVWTAGNPGQTFRGAQTLHVLTPSDMSTSTPIRIDCR